MLTELLIVLMGIPIGYLIAYYTREELFQGRKWFRVLLIVGSVLSIFGFVTKTKELEFTGFFITIVSSISYLESFKMNVETKKIKR